MADDKWLENLRADVETIKRVADKLEGGDYNETKKN